MGRVALDLEQQVDQFGWDRPASLWGLTAVDADVAMEAAGIHSDGLALAFALNFIEFLDGHPAEALEEMRAEDGLVGVLLSVEGWDYGEATKELVRQGQSPDFPPSQDPERAELRMVNLLLKDGTSVSVVRRRGEEAELVDGNISGRVMSSLLRYLALPSGVQPSVGVHEVASRGYVFAACQFIEYTLSSSDAQESIRAEIAQQAADGDFEAHELLADEEAFSRLVVHMAFGHILSKSPFEFLQALPSPLSTLAAAMTFDSLQDLFMARATGKEFGSWDEVLAFGDLRGDAFCAWADTGLLCEKLETSLPDRAALSDMIELLEINGLEHEACTILRIVAGESQDSE